MATQRKVQGPCYCCLSVIYLFCINFPDHKVIIEREQICSYAVSCPSIDRNKVGKSEAVASVRKCSHTKISS